MLDQGRLEKIRLYICNHNIAEPNDALLCHLRAEGFSKVESVGAIVSLFPSTTFSQAKNIVHLSDAWSDRFEMDEALHEQIFQALGELDSGSMLDFNQFFKLCNRGILPEDLYLMLRSKGYSDTRCIFIIRNVYNKNFIEAKDITIRASGLADTLDGYQAKLAPILERLIIELDNESQK